MVLVSHAHKFIFVLTPSVWAETAERFLEPFCKDPTPGRQQLGSACCSEHVCECGIVGRRGRGGTGSKWLGGLHIGTIKRHLGLEKFNEYTKIAVTVNPYEHVYHKFSGNGKNIQSGRFESFVNNTVNHPDDLPLISVNRKPIIDCWIRRDHFKDDLIELCRDLSLPLTIDGLDGLDSLIKPNVVSWKGKYTPSARDKVSTVYKWSIDKFGYTL